MDTQTSLLPDQNVEEQSMPSKLENAGRLGKYWHLAFCLLPLSLFPLFAVGILRGGYWLLLIPLFLQVLMPLLDLVTGWQDTAHFEKNELTPSQISLLNWNPRVYALLYMGAVIYVAMTIKRFTAAEMAMLIGSCSLLGGIAFAAAHELLHGKTRIDQALQRLITCFLCYPHYKLIHVRSHHVHTSTDHDENTAWLNETIYSYIFRTIPGSAIRCWEIESRNLSARDRSSGLTVLRNKMVLFALAQVALLAGLYFLAGVWGLVFYLAQVLGSHIVLESVNYIQHYGLMREQRDGEYEKAAAEHSWDTYHFFSSYVSFRVGHHSYHHLAVRPYYLLGTEPEAPKLPVGYFWAIAVVFLPPWWRRVIHPRLQDAMAGVVG